MSRACGEFEPLSSILDAPLWCSLCRVLARAGDCIPDVDGDGSLGCPVPDCGGLMVEDPKAGAISGA